MVWGSIQKVLHRYQRLNMEIKGFDAQFKWFNRQIKGFDTQIKWFCREIKWFDIKVIGLTQIKRFYIQIKREIYNIKYSVSYIMTVSFCWKKKLVPSENHSFSTCPHASVKIYHIILYHGQESNSRLELWW